jgi:hypothetical protein
MGPMPSHREVGKAIAVPWQRLTKGLKERHLSDTAKGRTRLTKGQNTRSVRGNARLGGERRAPVGECYREWLLKNPLF